MSCLKVNRCTECTKYETCAILHRFHILYYFAPVSYVVQFCTILQRFHILNNFAQVSYFVQVCTSFTFCTILHRFHIFTFCTGLIFCAILNKFHILCNFTQVIYFVQFRTGFMFGQFCTGFIFCSLQENATAKFDYQSRFSHIKMDNIKLSPISVQFHHGDDIYCMAVQKKSNIQNIVMFLFSLKPTLC